MSRDAWRLIDSGPAPGPWNLALDDAIFRSVRERLSPPTLRLYAWSRPTLSLGYAQDRDREVDLERCRRAGVEVLRRASGGRAVLHDRELTYSVAAPAGVARFGSGLEAAYRAVSAGIVAGLRLLGVPAACAPAPRAPAGAARPPGCFAAAARHEVTVHGRKLVGSAQRRRDGAFLQHGSILIAGHAEALERLLRRPGGAGAGTAMIGLVDVLDPCPGPAAIAGAVVAGCAAVWGVALRPGGPSAGELRLAGAYEARRYRAEAWNAGARGGALTADGGRPTMPGSMQNGARLSGGPGSVDARRAPRAGGLDRDGG